MQTPSKLLRIRGSREMVIPFFQAGLCFFLFREKEVYFEIFQINFSFFRFRIGFDWRLGQRQLLHNPFTNAIHLSAADSQQCPTLLEETILFFTAASGGPSLAAHGSSTAIFI